MIRDPSDGTVKEISPDANKINAVVPKTRSEGIDTGLRQPTRTDAQLRLDESRTWLKDYHAKKEREHAGADIEQSQHSTDGDSSEQAREAEPNLSDHDGPNRRTPRQG